MNIFITDKNPVFAAQNLCDKHCVRMITESAQLLCTSHWCGWQKMLNPPHHLKGKALKNWLLENIPRKDLIPQYSMTHVNHPSAQWARECWGNYNWLVRHGMALCEEYTRRYKKIHKTESIMRWARRFSPPVFMTNNIKDQLAITPFSIVMPEKYKIPHDPVESYRNYYHGAKAKIAKWKYTSPPQWWSPLSYHESTEG